MTQTSPAPSSSRESPPRGLQVRWVVCALLFAATTINYIDRQVIGVLKPLLTDQFHWSQVDYSNVIFAFQTAYAIGLLGAGYVLDRIGVRAGFALAVIVWSAAAMAHGLVAHVSTTSHFAKTAIVAGLGGMSVVSFGAARFALGVAEAGNFPAAIKTVAEWFPRRDRSLATGIFNAGSNVGALLTPMLVPWVAVHWGWPVAFYLTGSLGLLWVVVWLALYRSRESHPWTTAAELAYIRGDIEASTRKIPWARLLGRRQTWAFALAKMLTDPIWWFYLFWAPDFLHNRHGLDLKNFGPPLVVIYLMTDVGSIGGGWLSTALIKRGWSVNAGRKTAMLVCALCVVPIIAAAYVSSLWAAVLLIGLAASAHQGWSANLYTVVSDTTPRQAISSVVGIGGAAGAVGGMIVAKVVGYVLDWTHNSYVVPFAIAGSAYLVALLVLHAILPRLEPMQADEELQGFPLH